MSFFFATSCIFIEWIERHGLYDNIRNLETKQDMLMKLDIHLLCALRTTFPYRYGLLYMYLLASRVHKSHH